MSEKSLRERLRAGDPARFDAPLGETELTVMRGRLSRETAIRHSAPRAVPPAFAVAAAAALLVALLVTLPPGPRGRAESARPASGTDITDASAASRRIEFVAPGGTRIFWTLDSRFDGIDEE